MPGRNLPLVTTQIYHIFNRGTASIPIFLGQKDYERATETILYYQNINTSLRLSFLKRLPIKERTDILMNLRDKQEFLVEIISLCLMPNHIHLLVKQLLDNGISIFMSNFSNSYTRYFNTNQLSFGHIFQGKFKAVRIETDEQLIHVSRYIHLNPYTSYIVKKIDDLLKYPYSSLPEYLNLASTNYYKKDLVLSHFSTIDKYKKFIFDQADYQRELNKIKHLALDN